MAAHPVPSKGFPAISSLRSSSHRSRLSLRGTLLAAGARSGRPAAPRALHMTSARALHTRMRIYADICKWLDEVEMVRAEKLVPGTGIRSLHLRDMQPVRTVPHTICSPICTYAAVRRPYAVKPILIVRSRLPRHRLRFADTRSDGSSSSTSRRAANPVLPGQRLRPCQLRRDV